MTVTVRLYDWVSQTMGKMLEGLTPEGSNAQYDISVQPVLSTVLLTQCSVCDVLLQCATCFCSVRRSTLACFAFDLLCNLRA